MICNPGWSDVIVNLNGEGVPLSKVDSNSTYNPAMKIDSVTILFLL
jgi:hypothetical protein